MAEVEQGADAPEGELSAEDQAYFEKRGEVEEAGGDGGAVLKSEAKEPVLETKENETPPKEGEDDFNEDGTPKYPNRWVRHGALHEERTKRKEIEAKLREKELSEARVTERLKLISEAMAKPEQQQPDAPPDPETDIFAFTKWQAKKIADLEAKVTQTSQQSQEQIEEAQLRQNYQRDAAQFIQKTPEFADAYQFLLQGRDAELQAIGVDDPHERAARIQAEERQLVALSLQNGVSPSERIFNLAKARGFAAKKAEPDPAKPSADVVKLDTLAKGQQVAKSLSQVSGAGTDAIDYASLDKMSEEQFAAFMEKLPRSEQRKYLSGG